MKKCIRLPKSEYNVVAWCREPVHFLVEPFFFLGSNESIPPPGSLFQQKVIARLSLRLSLNWNWRSRKGRKEERRTKRTTEKTEGERKEQEKETKEEETTNQTWNRWNSEQDSKSELIWFRIQLRLVLTEKRRNKKKRKREGNKGRRNSN